MPLPRFGVLQHWSAHFSFDENRLPALTNECFFRVLRVQLSPAFNDFYLPSKSERTVLRQMRVERTVLRQMRVERNA